MSKCVNCGRDDLRVRHDNGGSYGMNQFPLGKGKPATVALDNLICVSCGHVEFFVSDEAARAKIAETWDRPSATGQIN